MEPSVNIESGSPSCNLLFPEQTLQFAFTRSFFLIKAQGNLFIVSCIKSVPAETILSNIPVRMVLEFPAKSHPSCNHSEVPAGYVIKLNPPDQPNKKRWSPFNPFPYNILYNMCPDNLNE